MNVLSLRIDRIINKFLLFCFLLLNWALGFGQVYTTVGTTNITIPAGSTYAVIECLGAGGAGGGADGTAAATPAYAGGGGGGAYSKVMIPVTPGEILIAFVGAGGASAGLNAFDGAPGQASYVSYNGTNVCKANGGLGGQGVTNINGIGGTGGNSGIGFLFAGGRGGIGSIAANRGGGGGGAAGSTGIGGNGSAPAGGTGGTGGFGSGTGGGGANVYNGAAGAIYGAGGGGAGTSSTSPSNGTGGAGSQGKIAITFCTVSFSTQPSIAAQTLCVGGTATTLTAISTSGGPYLWYSNTAPSNVGGVSTGVTTSTFNPPTGVAGTLYYYCVSGTGACAIPSTISGPISVGGAISVTGSTLLCGSGSVTLNATSPGATGYLWSPGGQTTSSITVSPSATTNYSVTTAGGSCPGVSNQTITVSPPITFSATVTSENLNGYTGDAGEILYLNAYPIQNNLMINGLNNSYTGSLGGTWTPSTLSAGSTCGGQAATLSFVASDTYIGVGIPSPITPQEGTHMLRFNSGFTDAGGIGYVTSPSFSTVGYTGMIIDFWFLQYVNATAGEDVAVEYRIGAGAWTAMTSNIRRDGGLTATKCPSWMNFSQEFPLAMMGQPAVQVRFRFRSFGCGGQQMLLDNIRISGVTAPGGYSYYSNYLWTSTANGVSANIANPLIRSTTTVDINKANTAGSILFNVQLTDGAGCVYNASDGVSINPSASGNVIAAASASPQVICSTPGTSNLSTLTGTGPATIQWEQSTVGPSGPWGDVPGATTINFTATGITQTTWYRIKPSSGYGSWSGICTTAQLTTTPVMVTIESLTPGILDNPGVTICAGANPAAFGMSSLPVLSGPSNYSYQWYATTGDVSAPSGSTIPAGWSPVGGSSNSTTPFVWLDNFDGGNSWDVGSGNFAVGAPGASNTVTTAYSGTNVLGTVLNGNYLANCTEAANFATSPTIDLTGVTSPVLKFWTHSRFRTSASTSTADGGRVYVSTDNGATWSANLLSTYYEGSYQQRTITLPAAAANNPSVKIRFTMYSNGLTHATGWNIDDVSIEGTIINPPPSLDPPVTNASTPTTTYALYITANGVCPLNSWAVSDYTVTIDPCPLPIELVSFNGECTGRDKVFSWITASELNNLFFTVEQSKDGQNYSPAINVPGAGTTTETQYYSATLANTSDEFSYFRLKQTDNDGAFDYSDVIYVGCDEVITTDEIWLFPNPASTQITLNVGGSIEGDYQLTIVDIVGKEIRHDLVQLSKNTSLVIDVNHLSRGNYFLKLKSANGEKDQHAIRFSIAK